MFKQILLMAFGLLLSGQSFSAEGKLEFSLVPPKTIEAGKAALIILPVRILDDKCSFTIKTKGTPEYPVIAPDKIESKTGNTIEYVPFTIQVPASAPSGQIYVMKVDFIPDQTCSDQTTLSTELLVKIQTFNSIEIDGVGAKETTKMTSTNFDLLLKNTGNSNLDLVLSVENFTPSVRVTARPPSLSLKAGEFRNAQINVDFSASGADFASFKVIATSKGQKFLSKVYQIRLLRDGSTASDERALQGQFFFTNEFFSEGSKRTNYSGVGANVNGDLSDYYALSAFLQSQYLVGEGESTQYEVSLNQQDNFKISVGSSLNPADASLPGIRNLAGVSVSKKILEDFQVGIYGGLDQENADHYGTFASYNQGFKSRMIVYVDKNNKTNFDSYGMSGEHNFKVTNSIAIAPSLVLARDEIRGDYSRIGASLSAIISKRAPLQLEAVREEDKLFILNRVESSISIPVASTNVSLGIKADQVKSKVEQANALNGIYSESYFRVLFPVNDFTQAQATIKYQTNPSGKNGVTADLYVSAAKNKWRAWARIGQQLSRGVDELILYPEQDINTVGKENYFQSDVQYLLSERTSLNLNLDYYTDSNDSYRYSSSFGVQHSFNDNKDAVKLNLRTATENNSFGKNTTHSVELGYYKNFSSNWTVGANTAVNYHPDLGAKDYSVNLTASWSPKIKVSKKVENAFGGRSTADLSGKVCIDYNSNFICDEGDKFLANVEVRLGSLVQMTANDGSYEFKSLTPGFYTLVTTKSTLPAVAVHDNSIFSFNLNANEIVKKDIALNWVGVLKVIAFEDKNKDGIWQNETESQLPDIEFSIFNKSIEFKGKTSSVRPTSISNIPRGDYKVVVTKLLPGSIVTQKDGVSVNMPKHNGAFAYLGLTFDDQGSENNLGIIVSLEDSLIFAPDFSVNFIIEDADQNIETMSVYCDKKLVSTLKPKNKTNSYDWKVDVGGCSIDPKAATIKLDVKILTINGSYLSPKNFTLIVN